MMIIDHICFAVRDTVEAVDYWDRIFGYEQMTETVINASQKVKVTFLKKENSIAVKLIEPLEDNRSLRNFVTREGGFHHICFRCENINSKIEELTDKGLRLLTPPEPGEAFNSNQIAFMLARYGMNIELIDTEEKSKMIIHKDT
jgi:methylmalonyl-CoA/ethylmalonyl-CoA epimerase